MFKQCVFKTVFRQQRGKPDLEKKEQKALKYQTELDLFVKAKKRWENALADLIEN